MCQIMPLQLVKCYVNGMHVASSSKELNVMISATPVKEKEQKYYMTLSYSGHEPANYHVQFPTEADRKSWREAIERQTEKLVNAYDTYYPFTLCDFESEFEFLCCRTFQEYIFLGTEAGMYVAKESAPGVKPRWTDEGLRLVLEVSKISQVEIIEKHDILLVLSGKGLSCCYEKNRADKVDHLLTVYPLSAILDSLTSTEKPKLKGEKLASGVAFFRSSELQEKQIICIVKSGAFLSSFKVYQVCDTPTDAPKKSLFKNQSTSNKVQKWKEFYIPSEVSSVHFIKNRIVVGTAKGFEVVDLDSLEPKSKLVFYYFMRRILMGCSIVRYGG